MAEQQRSNATRQSNNVADRLMQEGRLAVRRKQKLMADRELIESSMMEAPKPSKGTEILAKKSNIVGASFEERQLIHSEKMKGNEELRNKEVLAEQARYSLTHLLTHSLTHLLTHSLTHLLTHSLTHSLKYV